MSLFQCVACGKEKPHTAEHFYPARGSNFRKRCKICYVDQAMENKLRNKLEAPTLTLVERTISQNVNVTISAQGYKLWH